MAETQVSLDGIEAPPKSNPFDELLQRPDSDESFSKSTEVNAENQDANSKEDKMSQKEQLDDCLESILA